MLENCKPIQGIDVADVFAVLLRDLPWKSFVDYIQSNQQLYKRCTLGGHRIDNKKHRKRFEKIALQEAEKAEFSQEACSPAFAFWYPVHETLHKTIEDYFQSEEYKAYREEHELSEDAYRLPDDVFERFFNVRDIQKWRVLLCFSPLEFTDEQAARILSDSAGNQQLVEQLEQQKSKLNEQDQKVAILANETQELRTRLQQISDEGQLLRQERKELRAARDTLQNKFEAAQVENKRLRDELTARETHLYEHKEKTRDQIARETGRLSQDMSRLQTELADWQAKYEEQRAENRQQGEHIRNLEHALAGERQALAKAKKEVMHSHHFVDALLARLDWPEVGKRMRLTPQLKRKFNSLVKRLNYEDNRTLTLGAVLTDFWSALQREEKQLIDAISESDTREVESGDVEMYWLNLTDTFEDVYIGLEARGILLKILQEIFYQTIEMGDLQQTKVPAEVA